MKRKRRSPVQIQQETHAFFQRRAAGFDQGAFLQALAEVPDVPPEKHDRISPRGRRK
ncbi:MAG: hypothetical protein HYW07_19810 [Candidatus Latescibacteria bacterium]|nr:hypothetical protein [Candidatus Latescibacterota bacterium]